MKNFKVIILFIGVLFFSCSENDNTKFTLEDNSEMCDDSRLTDPNFDGTICCIKRNSDLNLNENIEYEYITNLSDANVTWKVLSGDIEIISGVDSKRVTMKLGKNFEEGTIQADGVSNDGDLIECDVAVLITKN